jgi:hypothetical protein
VEEYKTTNQVTNQANITNNLKSNNTQYQGNNSSYGPTKFNYAYNDWYKPIDKKISIDVVIDERYTDSIWNIFNYNNNKYMFSESFSFTKSNQNLKYEINLDPGNYAFVLFDKYGDGGMKINAYYNGKILVSHSLYTTFSELPFCIMN